MKNESSVAVDTADSTGVPASADSPAPEEGQQGYEVLTESRAADAERSVEVERLAPIYDGPSENDLEADGVIAQAPGQAPDLGHHPEQDSPSDDAPRRAAESSLASARPAASELLRSSQMRPSELAMQRPMEQSQALSSLAQLARSWAVQTFVPEVLSVTGAEQQVAPRAVDPHQGQTLYGEAAEVFIRQAKAYMQANELDKAIVACQEALAVSPDLAETHKLIGNMLQEMGRGVDAMGHYARALLANPTYPEVYANLGSFYARRGEWEDAELYYRKALQLRPENAAFLKPLAKVLEAQGKAEDSSQTFAQFLELEPAAASAEEHYRIGEFFREQGDDTKAIESYRRAVNLDEAYSLAYRPLAELLEKQGDWQAATAYYRKVLQSGLSIKQSEAAAKPLAEVAPATSPATSLSPSTAQAPSKAQVSLQQLLKQAKHVRLLNSPEQAVQKATQNGESSAVAQGSAVAQPLVQSSAGQQSAAAEAAPPEASAENYARSGQLQAKEQNWERAIEYYQKSLQLKPRQPEVLREFARVLSLAGQPEQAAQAWYQAFRLEPDWATAEQCYNLGDSLAKQGKLEQATVCYKLSIRRDAQFGPAYEHLGRVLELQEDPAGAMAAYRKALSVKEGVAAKKS